LFLLVYVHSSSENIKHRETIRETWARRTIFPQIRLVFMLGFSNKSKINEKVLLESSIYNDIVQENFIDSYRNLTYKAIMSMKWISEYCNHTQHILKVDDDMLVNMFFLMRHLNYISSHGLVDKNTIMCKYYLKAKVIRKKKYKWYVSYSEYRNSFFQPYCSGSAFILSGDLASRFYNLSLYTNFFWIDDYYLTGLLAKSANVTFVKQNSLYVLTPEYIDAKFRSKYANWLIYAHYSHSLNLLDRMRSLWNSIYSANLFRDGKIENNLNDNINLINRTMIYAI
jgi:beta-1,3-galactosyltransferase 1